MTDIEVRDAYARRADEYTSLFGSMAATHELDRQLVSRWAAGLSGPVIDAGCGPGHWTDFLQRQGKDVEGVDLVPAFVAQAKDRFPDVSFRVAPLGELGVPAARIAGVLAWYSLIHTEPARVPSILHEFARCIGPGGRLLLGLCRGTVVEPFSHAVTTAYFWPADSMAEELVSAGFMVEEVHIRTEPGQRPHVAIVARRASRPETFSR